ncbi:MAG: DUF885 domain-containing protein, partial [Psychroserpens sp.]|nr:DUF885 domain-containing protein [Psychroserpens sp.]
MKNILTLLLVLVIVTSCKSDKDTIENIPTNEAFESVLSDYYQSGLKINPINATSAGDHRYNDELPNFLSDEYQAMVKDYYQYYKTKLNEFDDSVLSKEQKLSKQILEWECDINLEAQSFNEDLTPINQMWSLQLSIGQLASGAGAQPFETVEDYENWLSRLDGYLEWMASAETKMKEGIAANHVLPKSLIRKVLPQLEALTITDLSQHLFYKPILDIPETISEEDKNKLTEAYQNKITNQIIPAYTRLHDFMSTTYFEAGRRTSGIYDTPNGEAYYNHQIKKYTTTDMTADEIHELGLKEVDRILKEMNRVKNEVGYERDLISFFDHVRTNRKLMPYTQPEEVLKGFQKIKNIMEPQVNNMFDLKPITKFEIRRTEAFREASASAEYSPGSLDGSRPGIFYTPIPDATTYNRFSDEALFLHEAIPGHHFQISLQQENKQLPDFRKTLWYS